MRPFAFPEASLFFGKRNLARRIEYYSVLGGMPMYLNIGARYGDLWQMIEGEILNPRSILYEELPLMLSQDLC